MRVWFGFTFFEKNVHEPYWHSCMEHQFLDCTDTSSVVDPDGNSSTRGRKMAKPWSNRTCGVPILAQAFLALGVFVMNRGWRNTLHSWSLRCCAWCYRALCAFTALQVLEKPHGCDCKPHSWSKCLGIALVQKLWHLLQICFFPFFSTGWQHQI